MFRFANPEYLYLLFLLPVLVVGFILLNIKKKKDLRKLGSIRLAKKLMPELSLKRSYLKFWLVFGILFLGIIAASRPQFGVSKEDQVNKKGIELVVAIDVSNSMMAQDVAPCRLDKAKLLLTRIIDERKNDKVAIVVFAGEAFVQLPMTTDTQSAKMFLQSINTKLVPVQGTVIGSAVNIAMNSFSGDKDIAKSIVLITDGEGHDNDNGAEIVARAAKAGIQINVLGVGSTNGAPVPGPDGDPMTDQNGKVVISKMNEEMCKSLASAGKGYYGHVDNTNKALKGLQNELNKLQTKTITGVSYSASDEKFRIFAILMLLLLVIEVCVFDKKNRLYRNVKLFK